MTIRVHHLALGHVQLPSSHPRAVDRTCPITSFVIDHPDGVIVVDTGPRTGHPVIDELYAPEVVSIVAALHAAGIDERRVAAVVNTHLHFDHCGQNDRFPTVPVWVTAAEAEVATEPYYTVPEWAEVGIDRRRLAVDGEQLAPGVTVLHTPGHTPGHLSLVVDGVEGAEVIVGQACYTCAELRRGEPEPSDLHSEDWLTIGRESLRRLLALDPVRAYLSHDLTVYRKS